MFHSSIVTFIPSKNFLSFQKILIPFLILFVDLLLAAPERFGCDILDADCRERISRDGFESQRHTNRRGGRCNYQDLWLIPGRADASCS